MRMWSRLHGVYGTNSGLVTSLLRLHYVTKLEMVPNIEELQCGKKNNKINKKEKKLRTIVE